MVLAYQTTRWLGESWRRNIHQNVRDFRKSRVLISSHFKQVTGCEVGHVHCAWISCIWRCCSSNTKHESNSTYTFRMNPLALWWNLWKNLICLIDENKWKVWKPMRFTVRLSSTKEEWKMNNDRSGDKKCEACVAWTRKKWCKLKDKNSRT